MSQTISTEDQAAIERVRDWRANSPVGHDIGVLLKHYDQLLALPDAKMTKIEDVLELASAAGASVTNLVPVQLTFDQPGLLRFASLLYQVTDQLHLEPWQRFTQFARLYGYPEPVKTFGGPDSFVNSKAWSAWQQWLAEDGHKSDLFDSMKSICRQNGWEGNGIGVTHWLRFRLERARIDAEIHKVNTNDANKWRALTQDCVMTWMGSAGYGLSDGRPDPTDYRHCTINFWSHRGPDYEPVRYATQQSAAAQLLNEMAEARIRLNDREVQNG